MAAKRRTRRRPQYHSRRPVLRRKPKPLTFNTQAAITGDRKLDALLRRVVRKEGIKIGTRAVNAALQVVVQEIRKEVPPLARPRKRKRGQKLPKRYQHSRRSITRAIGKRFLRRKRANQIVAKAGVKVGRRAAKATPHAHLLALGTKKRHRQRLGGWMANRFGPWSRRQLRTGRVKGDDFVKRGRRAAAPRVPAIMAQSVEDGMRKYFARK